MSYRELEQKELIKPCRARPKQVQRRLQDAAQHLTNAKILSVAIVLTTHTAWHTMLS